MALPAALTIDHVFGKNKSIAEIVKSFDFTKFDVRDANKEDYLTVGLAPSLGKLNSSTIKQLDDSLKVMITGITKLIARIPPNKRTWDNVVSALQQNTLIEPMDDGICRSDKLIKKAVNVFKVDGSPDDAIVREVHTWFVNLIRDEDVLNSTQIDIKVMGRIVAQTGATIVNLETFFRRRESHQKTMLDIGVLRYPDMDQPYFKVYRIKLDAWSDCTRILFVQDDSNGITGEYSVRKYKPRESVMKGLKRETIKKAVEEAEALLA